MNNIILTGPKHCGKTTAGKMLAALIKCDFFDIDELIFQNTAKSPRQLFAEDPEQFIKAETAAVASLFGSASSSEKAPACRVTAAGGGLIDNCEAMQIIALSCAVTVYLSISASAAWNRIVITCNEDLPLRFRSEMSHRLLHERRSAAYCKAADIVIDAESKTPCEIASEIHYKISF